MNDHPSRPPIPRGTRPDAETAEKIYLIKKVAALRATYQVRLLAYKANEHGKKLVLKVPQACRFDVSLTDLARAMPHVIQREDLP